MENKSYLSVFPEIFLEGKESLNKKINKIKAGSVKEQFIARNIHSLAGDYNTLAIGEWLLHHDVVGVKKYFYLEAKIQELLFQKYDDKNMIVSPSFVNMSSYLSLLPALISDSRQLIDSLARLIGNRPKEEKGGHPFADNMGYAIKYLLLNEDEKAKLHIEQLVGMENKKELRLRIGYGRVLKGILDADERAVHGGLKVMLDGYKKDNNYKDSPEEFFCIPVLAFAKLAIRRGINVNIDDPIVPTEILLIHEIEYPTLDFIK